MFYSYVSLHLYLIPTFISMNLFSIALLHKPAVVIEDVQDFFLAVWSTVAARQENNCSRHGHACAPAGHQHFPLPLFNYPIS